MHNYLIMLGLALLCACSGPVATEEKSSSSGKDGWLTGTNSEKFDEVASQLRGFDMAMVETGYRYQELYWAGHDANWDYAQYQLEKIGKAINNGLIRRPKRGASAQHFLTVSLPDMENAVAQHDTAVFNAAFNLFTNACNNCHAKENVPFFTVQKPVARQSPIRQ